MTEALMQFHAAELMAAHEALDKAGIPRLSEDGEKLSISQRCEEARVTVSALEGAMKAISRARGG